MKYLIKRNDFLRTAKRLDEKSEFLRDAKLSGNELYQELIKEEWDSHGNTGGGSGPMANDIGWHDSLVGRFLNHLVRKAKVAANLMRIKPLIRRLEGEFDRIAAEGVVYKMDADQKKLYIKTILYSFFYELKEAIKKGEEVAVIIRLTETAIASLETITDEELDDRTKELMLKELELFLEFLKQFSDEEGQGQGQGTGEEDEEDEENQSSEEGDGILTPNEAEKLAPAYPTMLKNLEALKLIIANYKKVQIGNAPPVGTQKGNKKDKYITQKGDTIESIQKNTGVNKKNLKSIDILNKNLGVLQNALGKFKTPEEKIKAPLDGGLALVMEGLFIFEATIGTGAGKDRNKVAGGEDHLTQAYTKLKKDIEVLESDKEKEVGIDFEFLDALVSNAKNTESKSLIKSLYNDINRYLVGDRKATIQEKDPLYKESYEYLMPRTAKNLKGGKIQVVAEKIARFAKRALQFDGENLYGGLGDLKNPLQSFVETMKLLMKNPIVKEEPKKAEPKKDEVKKDEVKKDEPKKEDTNERALFKYDRFVSYIKEADDAQDEEDDDTSASDPRSGMTTSEKIQDYFDKKCLTIKEFTMEKTEFEKVKANFDKIQKDKDGFIIDGYDPIIEILKLFNRAYKLYTSKHISKRSNGAGVSTDSEYTSFGENGPYRNNKIFDAWENAVLDIMKDRKYQFIFDKKTKLRVGDELRPNGGANLRKFMTDMMDGENLYKSKSGYSEGGQGTQAKLLDRYFGEADEKSKAELDKTGGAFDEGEGAANAKKAAEIKKAAVVIKPTKWENAVRDNDPGQRANVAIPESFFVIKGKMDGQEIKRAFFIQKIEGGFTYMQYSKSFGAFKGYLGRIDGAKTFEDGDLNISTEKKDVYYTKIKTNDFDKIFLSPGTISVGRMTPGKEDVNVDKIELIATYWITKEKDDKDVVYGAIQKGAQIGTDDRKRKQLEDALGDTKSIVSKIVSKNDVITEKK
jgi:LysM repeat protein